MTITVQSLLEGAYLRSSANDAGKLAWDSELIAHLDRVYQRTWGMLARARPDAFGATTTLTLASIPPSAALPASLIDVLHVADSTGADVHLVPAHEAQRAWHLAPSVIRRGLTLVSRNLAGDPTTNAVLTVQYLDAPAALATLGASLDARWPARHAQFLVDALACYLSTKDTGRTAAEHAKLLGEARQSGAALVAEYGLPPASIEWAHAPAERATGSAA